MPQKPISREWGPPHFDVCALLAKEEVEQVMGVTVQETKATGSSDGALLVSQCFYLRAPAVPAVTLWVSEGEPSKLEDYWNAMFHPELTEKKEDNQREEEERESAPSVEVAGLGKEAYWRNGVLFILRENSLVGITVGLDPSKADLTQARALAEKVMVRK